MNNCAKECIRSNPECSREIGRPQWIAHSSGKKRTEDCNPRLIEETPSHANHPMLKDWAEIAVKEISVICPHIRTRSTSSRLSKYGDEWIDFSSQTRHNSTWNERHTACQ